MKIIPKTTDNHEQTMNHHKHIGSYVIYCDQEYSYLSLSATYDEYVIFQVTLD